MRLATFKTANDAGTTVGGYVDDCYLDLSAATGGAIPPDMIEFLELVGDPFLEFAKILQSKLAVDMNFQYVGMLLNNDHLGLAYTKPCSETTIPSLSA